MSTPTDSGSSVSTQISSESVPSTPSWFGEVAVFAQVLTQVGILKVIQEQVRFARARFGHYDLIDFVVVLIGYILSGEPTLKAFYERLQPFAEPFMALFGRTLLPHRSTLSRFLAAFDQRTGELLRSIQVLIGYAKQVAIPRSSIVIRLDGLYGNAAPLSDVLISGLGLIAREPRLPVA